MNPRSRWRIVESVTCAHLIQFARVVENVTVIREGLA